MTTIQLSLNSDAKKHYITGVDEETKNRIFKAHKENKLKELNKELNIKCDNILKYSSTKECRPSALSPFLGKFIGSNGGERSTHYRDYSKTEQKQRDNAWLINACPDVSSSTRSLLSQIPETYIFLWHD